MGKKHFQEYGEIDDTCLRNILFDYWRIEIHVGSRRKKSKKIVRVSCVRLSILEIENDPRDADNFIITRFVA